MDIGKNIKKRREELGLSADALAERIGKNRTTIYRYENGNIENLPTSVLVPIAEALLCTPAYLMGWTDSPYDRQVEKQAEEDVALITKFHLLEEKNQQLIIDLIDALLRK